MANCSSRALPIERRDVAVPEMLPLRTSSIIEVNRRTGACVLKCARRRRLLSGSMVRAGRGRPGEPTKTCVPVAQGTTNMSNAILHDEGYEGSAWHPPMSLMGPNCGTVSCDKHDDGKPMNSAQAPGKRALTVMHLPREVAVRRQSGLVKAMADRSGQSAPRVFAAGWVRPQRDG